jgi:hypothetical protein
MCLLQVLQEVILFRVAASGILALLLQPAIAVTTPANPDITGLRKHSLLSSR